MLKGYGYKICDQSNEDLCSQIAAITLNTRSEKGEKTIYVIGSTNAVAAYVFRMEDDQQFTAVSHNNWHMTVTEIASKAKIMVRQQPKNKKDGNTTTALKELQLTLREKWSTK